jgi:hypothetical protein
MSVNNIIIPRKEIDPSESLRSFFAEGGAGRAPFDQSQEKNPKVSVVGQVKLSLLFSAEELRSMNLPGTIEFNMVNSDAVRILLRSEKYSLPFVTSLSCGEKVAAVVSATNGKITKRKKITKLDPRLVIFRGSNQAFSGARPGNVLYVYPATAIALRLLEDQKHDLFAEFVAKQPERIIGELVSVPVKGTFFSSSAIVALLKKLAPEDIDSAAVAIAKAKAADLAVRNYLQFANPVGAKSTLPKKYRSFHEGGKSGDILAMQGAPLVLQFQRP